MRKLYNRLAREDGQTMAEYGVVLTVITLASCTALLYLSTSTMKRVLTIAGYISQLRPDTHGLRYGDHASRGSTPVRVRPMVKPWRSSTPNCGWNAAPR
jgi:Flp pilus assembly pilin Flp